MSLDQKPPALATAIIKAYAARPLGALVELSHLLLHHAELVILETEAGDDGEHARDNMAARHLLFAQAEIDAASRVMRRGDWYDAD